MRKKRILNLLSKIIFICICIKYLSLYFKTKTKKIESSSFDFYCDQNGEWEYLDRVYFLKKVLHFILLTRI